MPFVRLIPLVLVLLAVSAASAQPVRPGVVVPERAQQTDARLVATVVDAETGEPLPGATAQVLNETGGASADRDGRLELDLPYVPAVVVVRYIGYASAQIEVTAADVREGVVRRTVRLSPAPYVLGEVTVTGEPPGEILWRRLLARRAHLAARLGVYAAEAYSRLLLTRDGPTDVRPVAIGLTETLSNLSWRNGTGLREEVVARHRLPEGGPFRWARLGPLPDLYFEDVLWLDGRPVPSPTAPDALRNYAFRLGETVEADGLRYLDLAVIPRRGGLVSGRIRVVDTLLVIAEADLRADVNARGGPVDDFDASYRWDYEPVWVSTALGDSAWLPRHYTREGRVTVSLLGNQIPTVHFRQTTVLDLILPGIAGQADGLRRRYRNPRGVYGGRSVYRVGRSAAPLDSLERVADTSEWIRTSSLGDLLRPQTGIGISFGIPGVGRALGADVEGEDDE